MVQENEHYIDLRINWREAVLVARVDETRQWRIIYQEPAGKYTDERLLRMLKTAGEVGLFGLHPLPAGYEEAAAVLAAFGERAGVFTTTMPELPSDPDVVY